MEARMARIERTNEKYNRALTKEILRLAKMPPEKTVSNVNELLEFLDEGDAVRHNSNPLPRITQT